MTIEARVAKVGDFQDGDRREVTVGETKVLLTRLKGKFYAIGAECTHYGGPLAEGALQGERVVCPWHQAAFNVVTGDLEEPPALDAQPCFAVRVEGDDVIVAAPEKPPGGRTPAMVRRDPADGRLFAIIGAGAAGNAATETLRQAGFAGRLVMVTQESRLPYDRPNLSKGYLSGDAGPEALPLRTAEFYESHDIEVLLNHRVTRVEAPTQTITFAQGPPLHYDALLLAPGGVPRRLQVPGADLAQVFTLRSVEDADRVIIAAGQASRVVAVGSGFIALEAAASLTKRGLQVTVVAPGAIPLQRQLGPEIGRLLQQVHEEHGVSFRLGRQVARLEGQDRVRAAVLDNGEQLPADLVVVGIGVRPATHFLQGIDLNIDGSVSVDRYLRVAEGLYAAGDIARFPDWRTGEGIRIEHWRLAAQHGRCAARNMAGKQVAFTGVPFFWTEQFNLFFQYVGYAAAWDELIVHGDLEGRNFMAFYARGGRVLAAAGLQHDAPLAAVAELLRLDRLPTAQELRAQPSWDPVAYLQTLPPA